MERIKYKVLKTCFSLLEGDEICFNYPNSDYYFQLLVLNRKKKSLFSGNEKGEWSRENRWDISQPKYIMKEYIIPYFEAMEFKINYREKHESNPILWKEGTNNWYENERLRIIQDFINLGIIEKIN